MTQNDPNAVTAPGQNAPAPSQDMTPPSDGVAADVPTSPALPTETNDAVPVPPSSSVEQQVTQDVSAAENTATDAEKTVQDVENSNVGGVITDVSADVEQGKQDVDIVKQFAAGAKSRLEALEGQLSELKDFLSKHL